MKEEITQYEDFNKSVADNPGRPNAADIINLRLRLEGNFLLTLNRLSPILASFQSEFLSVASRELAPSEQGRIGRATALHNSLLESHRDYVKSSMKSRIERWKSRSEGTERIFLISRLFKGAAKNTDGRGIIVTCG